MSERVNREIADLLDEAEALGRCAAVGCDRLRRALVRRCADGELVSPRSGLFARAPYWKSLAGSERARHVLLGLHELHPDWAFCGPSAAVLLDLSVSNRLLREVHLAVAGSSHWRDAPGIRRHVTDADELVEKDGVSVTSLERTAFDCMRWLSLREGLVVADSALRTGGLARSELEEYVRRHRGGYHGIVQARATAALADARSENGGESLARAVMWELGFAMPDLQVEVPNPFSGSGVYRVDFRWVLPDGTENYGELDGGEKYWNPEMNGGSPLTALRRERSRESLLTVAHAGIIRFTPQDVANTAFFDWLLRLYGTPREREPLIQIPSPGVSPAPEPPVVELVPVEAYGLRAAR